MKLSGVTIINRADCCGNRLRNVQVRAGRSSTYNNAIVGTFKGPGVSGAEHPIKFTKTIVVEYLQLQIITDHKTYFQINGIKIIEPKSK